MKIEVKPSVREFTLTVNVDELRLIENALLDKPSSAISGSVNNYDVWLSVHQYMSANSIARMED